MEQAYFIGMDVGTQGARVVMLDERGNQIAACEEGFYLNSAAREEQCPKQWWSACRASLLALCSEAAAHIDMNKVKAITVTSTSGTIIPLNAANEPLHNAIMYSDTRQHQEGAACTKAALAAGVKGYTAFNTSSGLSKMIWFLLTYPQQAAYLHRFVHAADFITGQLCGNFAVTDYTNALKSGFDLLQLQWPGYLVSKLYLQRHWLPAVGPSGMPMGTMLPQLAQAAGLPPQVMVTTGITDGCASQLASGAVHKGDWNTTIGTTLVVKGVTHDYVEDPSGALYCHRHPEGYWMPGGASNTGADWITRLFYAHELDALNQAAQQMIPTTHLAWPLLQQGERFPFIAPRAMGFAPEHLSDAALYTANMEGVAYMERLAYDRIARLSHEHAARIFTAGGGSQSDVWLTIRSNVLNLPLCKMKQVSGAAGAAILAASRTYYNTLTEAATAMVQPDKTIMPNAAMANVYQQNYTRFTRLLQEKGYLNRQ